MVNSSWWLWLEVAFGGSGEVRCAFFSWFLFTFFYLCFLLVHRIVEVEIPPLLKYNSICVLNLQTNLCNPVYNARQCSPIGLRNNEFELFFAFWNVESA